jgi:hypothetical protein
MSISGHLVQHRSEPNPARRIVGQLLAAAAVETLLTIGHFHYGSRLYEDPSRLHVIAPALGFLLLALAMSVFYLFRPGIWTLWPLVAFVAAVYVGLFGIYHGAFGHALKDILFFAGTTPERLGEIFDSPDFVVPDDFFFELTGVATFLAALLVGYCLVRLIRLTGRRS